MKKKFAYIVASLFGFGFSPFASGTVGSFASFVFIVPFTYFFGLLGVISFTIISFILGLFASKEVLKYTEHDPSLIVIDETSGQTLTFLFTANILYQNFSYWYIYLIGFILFRFFDITKPLFVGWVDKHIENSFGVMFDDILAGFVASVFLYIISIFIL